MRYLDALKQRAEFHGFALLMRLFNLSITSLAASSPAQDAQRRPIHIALLRHFLHMRS
jgi:hypothetical protein